MLPEPLWCSGSRQKDQSGFTLVELVVGMMVAALLLMAVASFFISAGKIVQRLKIEREIRDVGLLATEAIERQFRETLEYGGKLTSISGTEVSAQWGGGSPRTVQLALNGDLTLTVTEGSGEETVSVWPGNGLTCRYGEIQGLVSEAYVKGDMIDNASAVRVVVIQFQLGDEKHDLWRWFKAAFSRGGS